MSDPDRGAYTPPTDAPLAFDARQPVRGGGPAPVMLILSALVLIALVVAIIMFYRSGVREAGQPPRTVGEPVGQMKGAPPAEDQPDDPAQGLQIYQSEEGETAPAAPNFTAPPEQPQARP
ncbi:MAG TPA: SPOR domain-containing protein, partial [Phenylobacterium sp.]